jgi:hypothetical protein
MATCLPSFYYLLYLISNIMKQFKTLYFLFITLLLILLFNFPMIETVNKNTTIFGIPTLPIYVMIIWILAVVLLYVISKNLFKSKK